MTRLLNSSPTSSSIPPPCYFMRHCRAIRSTATTISGMWDSLPPRSVACEIHCHHDQWHERFTATTISGMRDSLPPRSVAWEIHCHHDQQHERSTATTISGMRDYLTCMLASTRMTVSVTEWEYMHHFTVKTIRRMRRLNLCKLLKWINRGAVFAWWQ